ncbi:hypothetical protein CMV_008214 [Castanea mollissima]|uniref:Uncharacterized protein n=1 Tax=Castanea mollissima TaxID=60419 RepID=A0A8J4RS57_9ROSI|nr:hypothetical protein CMV_008214 [Castanea mollissima]
MSTVSTIFCDAAYWYGTGRWMLIVTQLWLLDAIHVLARLLYKLIDADVVVAKGEIFSFFSCYTRNTILKSVEVFNLSCSWVIMLQLIPYSWPAGNDGFEKLKFSWLHFSGFNQLQGCPTCKFLLLVLGR